ncbi:hypothetical protein FALBO_16631 [Fusarium albosuccineum]|uniref:Uncharacterized protein n=1 Tax=Fusarium albosuccineum TaxID=1237068 RepID=A0A8H4KGV7_9HYPO|nr:hypothetical protein FALBO_16631 [Fusarium albosuccineum]
MAHHYYKNQLHNGTMSEAHPQVKQAGSNIHHGPTDEATFYCTCNTTPSTDSHTSTQSTEEQVYEARQRRRYLIERRQKIKQVQEILQEKLRESAVELTSLDKFIARHT